MSEGHIIAVAALVGVLMIIRAALLSSTNGGLVGRAARSAARGISCNIGRLVVDHAFGAPGSAG